MLAQLSYAPSDTLDGHDDIPASVPALFLLRRPSHVEQPAIRNAFSTLTAAIMPGFVVRPSVDAFIQRTGTQVCEEVGETVKALADANASPAPQFKVDAGGILSPLKHNNPRAISARSGEPVLDIKGIGAFAALTTGASSERSVKDNMNVVAQKTPDLASSASNSTRHSMNRGVINHNPIAKGASDKRYFGRHNVRSISNVVFSDGRWRSPTLVAILAFLLTASSARAAFFNNYDHESRAWRTNVLTVGVLSGNCYVAATRFMLQTRAAGLRPLIYRLNFFAGPNTNACRKPIIALLNGTAGESASDFLTGTNENSYSEANGVVFAAGGTSMYATGFNPTNLPLNSAHLAIYVGGTPGQNGNVDIGAQVFPSLQFFSMVTGFTTTGESVNIWTNGGFTGFANTNGTGYFMGSRTSSATTGVKMYRFGVLDATSTAVGSSPPNTAGSASAGMYVLGLNSGGSPILASSRIGRGYQIGLGFDATQAASSAKIWQRFETTLGRAVTPY